MSVVFVTCSGRKSKEREGERRQCVVMEQAKGEDNGKVFRTEGRVRGRFALERKGRGRVESSVK